MSCFIPTAALNRDESDDSGVKTWAVVTTVVASVAGVVLIIAAFAIGILVRSVVTWSKINLNLFLTIIFHNISLK